MKEFILDDKPVPFRNGQTIIQAAMNAGIYIPHLCFHPEFRPHGSCRVCIVKVDGRYVSACTTPAVEGAQVLNIDDEVQLQRKQIVELMFIEGNHVCPSCEKSGACALQALARFCNMLTPTYSFQFPNRCVDASHDEFMLEYNRCILCGLCVQVSTEVDNKSVFIISGRGHQAHLAINATSGLLGDSEFAKTDRAASVCPVGVILPKHKGFSKPIGQRNFDIKPLHKIQSDEQ